MDGLCPDGERRTHPVSLSAEESGSAPLDARAMLHSHVPPGATAVTLYMSVRSRFQNQCTGQPGRPQPRPLTTAQKLALASVRRRWLSRPSMAAICAFAEGRHTAWVVCGECVNEASPLYGMWDNCSRWTLRRILLLFYLHLEEWEDHANFTLAWAGDDGPELAAAWAASPSSVERRMREWTRKYAM